jgi:hypothetical protein
VTVGAYRAAALSARKFRKARYAASTGLHRVLALAGVRHGSMPGPDKE